MRFHFHTDVYFESWDWRNIESGIGGSETHQVEMAERLAKRGHDVTCYGPVPEESDGVRHKGVLWLHHKKADFSAEGVWVIYRSPHILDKIKRTQNRVVWFIAQDEWYNDFTPERVEKLDRFVTLCETHAAACVSRCPELKAKMVISSNGLKMDLIRDLEAEGVPERNPYRLMYASSPDRGLEALLKIFKRAREFVPDLELHAFYGFDNIDKLIALDPVKFGHYRRLKERILKLADQPGVTWHGRVGQRQLYREMLKTSIWCYPTNFTETSCIQCMEMQALGAIPITNPLWALKHNVMNGFFIPGDAYGDRLVQARYAAEIVRLVRETEFSADVRRRVMAEARYRFNWERVVDQWEAWIGGYEDRVFTTQYNFQLKHAVGKVLNVGCDIDLPKFGEHGGVNLDMLSESPILKCPTSAHIFGDIRTLKLPAEFETVILGDILEHMTDADAIKSLRNSRSALREGGRIVVTVPNDPRPDREQHEGSKDMYAEGESTFHRPVPRERLALWISEAGLRIVTEEALDYTFAEGFGVVCMVDSSSAEHPVIAGYREMARRL